MSPAVTGKYAVLRCVADSGRQEALNLGLVAWTEGQAVVRIERRAAQRIARQSPGLASGDLLLIGEDLKTEVSTLSDQTVVLDQALATWMADTARFPFSFSEVRETTITPGPDGLQHTVERLSKRIVDPPRTGSAEVHSASPDPVKRLVASLSPLVCGDKVIKAHRFQQTRSGVEREVDYFANSTASTALDVVRLTAANDRDIRARGDAAAFKIEDILSVNAIKVMVFCVLRPGSAKTLATADALASLRSVEATVHTDADAAADRFRRVALGANLLD